MLEMLERGHDCKGEMGCKGGGFQVKEDWGCKKRVGCKGDWYTRNEGGCKGTGIQERGAAKGTEALGKEGR